MKSRNVALSAAVVAWLVLPCRAGPVERVPEGVAVQSLLDVACDAQNPLSQRTGALEQIGAVGPDISSPETIRALSKVQAATWLWEEPWAYGVAYTAIKVLGKIGTPEAIAEVGRIAGNQPERIIAPMQYIPGTGMIKTAVDVLEQNATPQAKGILEKMSRQPKWRAWLNGDVVRRQLAIEALERLSKKDGDGSEAEKSKEW